MRLRSSQWQPVCRAVVPKLFYMVAQSQGCKKFAAPLLQSHRHGELNPQTKCQAPPNRKMKHYKPLSLFQTFNIVREIVAHELYCCLLPWYEALPTCHSGFRIATLEESLIPQGHET